jgi:hypothetical protein
MFKRILVAYGGSDGAKFALDGSAAVLTIAGLAVGLAVGSIMILGSFVGKRLLDRLPEKIFLYLVEATRVIAGLNFLLRG